MKEILMNGQIIGVNASALTLLFYKQEFKRDFIADFTKFSQQISKDLTNYDGIALLQFVWALNKSYKMPEKQPSFEQWLATINYDFADEKALVEVMETIVSGLFRSQHKSFIDEIEKAKKKK